MLTRLARRTARPLVSSAERPLSSTASAAKSKPLLAHERPAGQTYTEAQANKKRPLSPHVTIYAFPASAISSITNRVTGVGLAVGCYGIGAMSFFGGDPAALMQTLGQSGVAPIFKFGVAFPLVYHYVCAIRHVAWDHYVVGFNNDAMKQSSFLVGGVSLALAGGAALM